MHLLVSMQAAAVLWRTTSEPWTRKWAEGTFNPRLASERGGFEKLGKPSAHICSIRAYRSSKMSSQASIPNPAGLSSSDMAHLLTQIEVARQAGLLNLENSCLPPPPVLYGFPALPPPPPPSLFGSIGNLLIGTGDDGRIRAVSARANGKGQCGG